MSFAAPAPKVKLDPQKLWEGSGEKVEREKSFDEALAAATALPNSFANTASSSAGAGSGEFHSYRNARRKELFRVQQMEEEHQKKVLDREWEAKRLARVQEQEEKNSKKAAKRKAKKERAKAKKSSNPSDKATSNDNEENTIGGDDANKEQENAKRQKTE